MNKQNIIIFVVSLFFSHSIQSQRYAEEKRINKDKVSKEILSHVEQNYADGSAKYYKLKTDNDSIFYEVKLKFKQSDKIHLIFNENNQLLRVDNEVHFRNVPKDIRLRIAENLSQKFSVFKVASCKKQNKDTLITYELHVIAKKKKYLFRFKTDGSIISYKEIVKKPIDQNFN